MGKQKTLAQNNNADSETDCYLTRPVAKGLCFSEKMMGFSWISALSGISLRFSARGCLLLLYSAFKMAMLRGTTGRKEGACR